MTQKDYILGIVKDLCADFLYYDRKEDEDLSGDELEEAVKNGIVTIDEMVETFREVLVKNLK
jgi:hypothetical protein